MGLGASSPQEPPAHIPTRQIQQPQSGSRNPGSDNGQPQQHQPEKVEPPKLLFSPAAVQYLISTQRLAPMIIMEEEEINTNIGSRSCECPICFLEYKDLNTVSCCRQLICTGCYINIRNTNLTTPLPHVESTVSSLATALGAGLGLSSSTSTSTSAVDACSPCPFCNKVGFLTDFKAKVELDGFNHSSGNGRDTRVNLLTGDDASSLTTAASDDATTAATTVSSSPHPQRQDPTKAVFVPVSSIADRREMEEAIQKQHRNASQYASASSCPDSRRSMPSEIARQRALRLQGAVRRSVSNASGDALSRSSSGSGNTSPRSNDPLDLLSHFLGGGGGDEEDMEERLMQAVMKESLKSQYSGGGSDVPGATGAASAKATDTGTGNRTLYDSSDECSGSSDSNGSDINRHVLQEGDDEPPAYNGDGHGDDDEDEDEELMAAIALSLQMAEADAATASAATTTSPLKPPRPPV